MKKAEITTNNVALKVCTSDKIMPGMIIYADNSASAVFYPNKVVKAIVGHVDDTAVLAICPMQVQLPWSKDKLAVPTPHTWSIISGSEATKKILYEAKRQNKVAQAAQWCFNFSENGVKEGEAFLPSYHELTMLKHNLKAINFSLAAVGAEPFYGIYWSATEFDDHKAWCLSPQGNWSYLEKDCQNVWVRPIIKLKIDR